jgi:quercetin dioxygenase-like cupin family protein
MAAIKRWPETMAMPTFDQFTATSLAAGFDEVLVREWAPSQQVASHSHAFEVSALVVRGDLVLTVGEQVHHLKAGDPFTLARDTPHTEQYGTDGATFWVARKN